MRITDIESFNDKDTIRTLRDVLVFIKDLAGDVTINAEETQSIIIGLLSDEEEALTSLTFKD